MAEGIFAVFEIEVVSSKPATRLLALLQNKIEAAAETCHLGEIPHLGLKLVSVSPVSSGDGRRGLPSPPLGIPIVDTHIVESRLGAGVSRHPKSDASRTSMNPLTSLATNVFRLSRRNLIALKSNRTRFEMKVYIPDFCGPQQFKNRTHLFPVDLNCSRLTHQGPTSV